MAQDSLPAARLEITDPVTNKKVPLEITELHCEVKVTGNRVQTDYYLTFYNPNARILEGTLEFPLGENENVVRFALDVNGNLREGVVVDKKKGQQIFEEIERRNIDPGLIEKTTGNSYRTRVYPILANGTKRLVIGCERILTPEKGKDMLVSVPVVFNQKIKKFEIRVDVYNENEVPVPEKENAVNFNFEKWNNVFTASQSVTDFNASHVLKFTIPRKANSEIVSAVKNEDGNYTFSVSFFPETVQIPSVTPDHIAVIWDASFSGTSRNSEWELNFLKEKLNTFNGKIKLITIRFNEKTEKIFTIKKGVTTELISELRNTVFDGATDLGNFDFNLKGMDEILLFTDGISTFGKSEFVPGKIPVHVYVTAQASDYESLKFLAVSSGGSFSNGNEISVSEAVKKSGEKTFRMIGISENSGISELYYDQQVQTGRMFTVSGISKQLPVNLKLNFGTGDTVLTYKTIHIETSDVSDSKSGASRIWALQKLHQLEMQPFHNRDKIVTHSSEWNLVTPFTSLIVLESVDDYVRYSIIPPDELKKEYFEIVENNTKEIEQSKKSRLDQVYELYKQKIEWYNIRYDDTIKLVLKENEIKAKIKDLQNQLDTLGRVQNYYRRILDSVQTEINNTQQELTYVQWQLDSLRSPSTHQMYIISEALKIENNIIIQHEMHKEMMYNASAMSAEMSMSANASFLFDADGVSNSSQRGYENNRKEEIAISEWDPVTPYMQKLKSVTDSQLYKTYLELRKDYLFSASFYLDVADYFVKKRMEKEAILLLSNLAELKNEDAPFIRILATRYMQMGKNEYALTMYEKALELRPEEPQSYRDLGLILERCGKFQQAIDTFYRIVERTWDSRFPAIENIVLTEMNKVITTCNKKLDLSAFDPRLLSAMSSDMRIVLTWDSDGVDIDLHVEDPNKEICFYGHQRTRIGGRMSNDYTGGYGPEEFMAHYAMDGNYKIKLKYYGENSVTILGPTTVMIQVFTNYGKKDQKVQEITRRLETTGEWLELGEIKFIK